VEDLHVDGRVKLDAGDLETVELALVAMWWMWLSSMVENTAPRCPTMPFWPQSKIVLRRTTCEPMCSRSHPICRAENTDSSWYW
jgi:hypothetical protein